MGLHFPLTFSLPSIRRKERILSKSMLLPKTLKTTIFRENIFWSTSVSKLLDTERDVQYVPNWKTINQELRPLERGYT